MVFNLILDCSGQFQRVGHRLHTTLWTLPEGPFSISQSAGKNRTPKLQCWKCPLTKKWNFVNVLIRCWWVCCTLDRTTSLRSMAWWSLAVSGCQTWLLCTQEQWHRLVQQVVSDFDVLQLTIMHLHSHILCNILSCIYYFTRSNIKSIFKYHLSLVLHNWLIQTDANINGFNLLKTEKENHFIVYKNCNILCSQKFLCLQQKRWLFFDFSGKKWLQRQTCQKR